MFTIDVIAFWILLLDSISANIVMHVGKKWYVHHFRILSRAFPPAKGWAGLYLCMVLWMGTVLSRMGALHF